jgi:hypothetical protein
LEADFFESRRIPALFKHLGLEPLVGSAAYGWVTRTSIYPVHASVVVDVWIKRR